MWIFDFAGGPNVSTIIYCDRRLCVYKCIYISLVLRFIEYLIFEITVGNRTFFVCETVFFHSNYLLS